MARKHAKKYSQKQPLDRVVVRSEKRTMNGKRERASARTSTVHVPGGFLIRSSRLTCARASGA